MHLAESLHMRCGRHPHIGSIARGRVRAGVLIGGLGRQRGGTVVLTAMVAVTGMTRPTRSDRRAHQPASISYAPSLAGASRGTAGIRQTGMEPTIGTRVAGPLALVSVTMVPTHGYIASPPEEWSAPVIRNTAPLEEVARPAVVFVHGLFSSGGAWEHFDQLIGADPGLSHLAVLHFEYSSPKFNWSPLRRIPDYNVLADNLQTYLEIEAADRTAVVIVSHSQGGLVVQRYLARMISNGRGNELARIRRIVMFACPNSGSQIFLIARRGALFWRHPQERGLRPINDSVTDAQQIVLSRVVHAQKAGSGECPIPIFAFAGESDNIVTPTSARSVFPDTGILPGDHFSIIRPDSLKHRAYTALKKNLLAALGNRGEGPGDSGLDARASPTGPHTGHVGPLVGEATIDPIVPNMVTDQNAGLSEEGGGEMSHVIARWNPRHRTLDFIMSPEIALTWINRLGEDEAADG
jgi:pimeloyl-ACP methyl ester carboxylesterase